MRRIVIALLLAFLVPVSSCLSAPTEEEWQALTDEALDHYYYGRNEQAIEVARQALKVGLELFGPDDLKVVGSYDNLASYLAAVGEYDEADGLYQKAFAILQKKLPPDDRYLAIFMDYLAIFYEKTGKTAYADELRARAKAIRFGKSREETAE